MSFEIVFNIAAAAAWQTRGRAVWLGWVGETFAKMLRLRHLISGDVTRYWQLRSRSRGSDVRLFATSFPLIMERKM